MMLIVHNCSLFCWEGRNGDGLWEYVEFMSTMYLQTIYRQFTDVLFIPASGKVRHAGV